MVTYNDCTEPAPNLQPSAASKLSMTRSQYRLHHPSADNQPYDKIVIGAAIFESPVSSTEGTIRTIMLLKRSAHEIYYPNVFELPSGNVDDSDASLKHALAREVKEETGLHVSHVLAQLPDFTYHTEKRVLAEDGTASLVKKTCVQLNFVVEVDGNDIQVNPDEHSVGVWATEEEVRGLEMTDGMRSVVANALAWREV